MFRRFWPTKWVYGNRRHWCSFHGNRRHECSFKAAINSLIWNDGEFVGLLSRVFNIWKISKNFQNFQRFFFLFEFFFPLKTNIFNKKKTYNMLEVNGWWICVQNFKLISSKMADIWHKTCQKQALFTSFRDLPWFSEFHFLTDFDASKSVLGSFVAFFAKIWPKNMYRSSKSRFFFAWPFLPGDLRWPWPLLWSKSTVNDTYKCERHYPCRFVGFVWA